MKQYTLFVSFCLMAFLPLFAFSPDTTAEEIVRELSQAIERGSSRDLSKYFGQNVELHLPRAEGTFSKTQSEMILRDFFNRNRPSSFSIIAQGVARDGSVYLIGSYSSRAGQTFRCYLLIKKVSQNYYLHHLQFDLQ